MDADIAGAKSWLKQNAALVLLGLALVASGVLLLALSSGLTFFLDTWDFLMNRRGFTATAYFEPHNEHIVVIPVVIEQLLLRLFGMTSAKPEYVVLTVLLLVTAVLVFAYIRRRVGPWPALMAAVLLLFLGPAWQVLLWPSSMVFVGSMLFGVAMLLALDRGDRRSDLAACGFLAISIAFFSLGLAFAVGAAVDVFQRRRSHGLRRAYIAAVPLLLYAAWYVGWGHTAESHFSLHNVLVSPRFVTESLVASIDSLLGLSTISGEAIGRSIWGLPLLIALVVLLIYGQIRKPGFSPRLWPVVASAVTFWFLAAFSYFPGREAYQSRYLYTGAAFTLLVAADLLNGLRLGRWALLAGGLITLVAVGYNLVPLREGRDWLVPKTALTRSDLAAIEIAHRTVDASFSLTPEIAGTASLVNVQAGEYLTAVREYGSPAYTPTELASAPEVDRRQADVVLAHALPVSIETKAGHIGATSQRGQCVSVPGGSGSRTPSLSLRPGITKVELASGEPATIRLRRFATHAYPLVTEGVPGGTTTLLYVPADGVARPWRLQVEAVQRARVCH